MERSQGGAGGGKSRLTPAGTLLLERYAAYAEAVRAEAQALFDEYFQGVLE